MQKFRLGLTMAGAVSAGAYTGGVLDYLIQALDNWNEAKKCEDDTIPNHEISIDIISGASAGGITGAMALIALHMINRNPALPSKRQDEVYLQGNVFYNAWVNLTGDDMLPQMLSCTDIDELGRVVSLLNSKFIEDIAKRTITRVDQSSECPPTYINKNAELVLTLSNLQGFTYNLQFSNGKSFPHVMTQFRDYAFFRLGDSYAGGGRIPLNLSVDDMGLKELLQAAMGTGAFPIGLAYREFERQKKYILDNEFIVYNQPGVTDFGELSKKPATDPYLSFNVDGGMLNNEPFDIAMKLMTRHSVSNNVKTGVMLDDNSKTGDATIIMIDPFPSEESIVDPPLPQSVLQDKKHPDTFFSSFPYTVLQAVGKIYGAIRGELLFKGEEIVKAFSKSDFTRFIIAPRRHELSGNGNKVINGSKAIACGALGGFSGFFDKELRRHDFYLGRRNCLDFLSKYFRVELDENLEPINPIFKNGYSKAAVEKFKFQDQDEVATEGSLKAKWYVPIIPVIDSQMKNEIPIQYPSYSIGGFTKHRRLLIGRLKVVVKSLSSYWGYSVIINLLFFFGSRKIFRKLKSVVESDFLKWGLM